MNAFIIIGAVMVLTAFGLVAWPVFKRAPSGRRWSGLIAAIAAIPLLGIALYLSLGNREWPNAATTGAPPEVLNMVEQLEERMRAQPDDARGWLMLGRSYYQLKRYDKAVDAYQKAYAMTRGQDVEAVTGLAESMIFADRTLMTGPASELFDQAYELAPRNAKALWYTGLIAYQRGDLARAHQRWTSLVSLEPPPPPAFKQILQENLTEIEAQLRSAGTSGATANDNGTAGERAASAAGTQNSDAARANDMDSAASQPGAAVQVTVSLAPALASKVPAGAVLFVLARPTGAGGGPPLAVKKLSAAQWPATVELSDRDAMIAGRGLSSVPKATVVARISTSGTPKAQTGDLEGRADFVVGSDRTVRLVIDSVVR